MSWTKALEHIATYRKERQEALNNSRRQKWFLSDVDTLKDLFDTPFDREDENTKWSDEYATKHQGGVAAMMAYGLKIDFLAGCVRDLRMQFGAGADPRVRRPVDWDRYEYMGAAMADYKMQELDMMLTSWEP